jgi:hypothetical protein
MATNNGNGNSDYPYADQPQQPGADGGSRYTYIISVVISLLIVVAIVKLARYILGPVNEAPQPAGGVDRESEPPAEVALEVRAPAAPGPVVCAYRKGDGWRLARAHVPGMLVRLRRRRDHQGAAGVHALLPRRLRRRVAAGQRHLPGLPRRAAATITTSRFSRQGHLHGVVTAGRTATLC